MVSSLHVNITCIKRRGVAIGEDTEMHFGWGSTNPMCYELRKQQGYHASKWRELGCQRLAAEDGHLNVLCVQTKEWSSFVFKYLTCIKRGSGVGNFI